MQTVSLELNELNFHFVKGYVEKGHLPAFRKLFETCQLFETHSEKDYPFLEPWIQWPTVYNGKTYGEHGIFRLGDTVNHEHMQIWEDLESQGLTVGAISPMNAANRCKNPDFFLPDPWTVTKTTADPKLNKLYELVRLTVNRNASDELSTIRLARQLIPAALPFIGGVNIKRYLQILPMALRHKWAKAGVLDRLLCDVFLSLIKSKGTQFASIFLNAGAHIQHHHMFDSSAYVGELRNPSWYSSAADGAIDPLLFIYGVYDLILSDLLSRPDLHVLITTGLSQTPNPRERYQYRIVEFDTFLARLGIKDAEVHPRMSRDFMLEFPTLEAGAAAKKRMEAITCRGKPLFSIEDRGLTFFCQVAYFGPPEGLAEIEHDGAVHDYSDDLVLVSIENGIHQTIGYHFDTRLPKTAEKIEIPLTEVYNRLRTAALTDSTRKLRGAA